MLKQSHNVGSHSVLRSSFIEICSVVFLWSCKETKLTEKQTDTSENKKLPVGGESQEVFPDPKLTSSKRFLSEKKQIYSLRRFFSQLSKLLFIARHKFPEPNVPTVQNTQTPFTLFTDMNDKEKQKVVMFKKLEAEMFWPNMNGS